MNDGDLLAHLDDPDDWLVLDARGELLVRSISLRHAIHQVRLCMSAGRLPASAVRVSQDPLMVGMDQLHRMFALERG
ncbi:MAG TPA: hypothetical protein VMQ73_11380 [Methylomirabilota bacterium]|nr:hypothetical protein [Methylomirabilota bacterium]